jgi:maleate isomerase
MDPLGFARAIGVIAPSGNLVVERVTQALLREVPEVSAHVSRIRVTGDRDPFPDSYDLEGMLTAARLLSHARPELILWNGSKGGTIGFAHDRELVARIEAETCVPATTSSLALVEALGLAGPLRLALVTPYAPAYQARMRATLAREGLDCVAESHLGLTDNLSYAGVEAARIRAQIREVAAHPARPQAVLTWGTNYPGAAAAAAAEAETGLLVLDATALPLWQALRRLGIPTAPLAPRWGRAFALG